MALTAEDWNRIASKCDSDQSQLMTRQERHAFLAAHVAEEDIARIYDVRSTQGGRRKLHYRINENWWVDTYERTPSGRALEDLVLECVEAGIDIELYL